MVKFNQFILMFLFLTLSCLFVGNVYGHPPKDIIIQFDNTTKILKCKIIHQTKDPKKHYIDDVKVFLNNKVIIKQEFKQQTTNEEQEVIYAVVDANVNDKISVGADCNMFGSLKKEINVKQTGDYK